MHSPRQKAFFDGNAMAWDIITVHDADKMRSIVSVIGINGSDDILDVGTGTGVMIPFYLERLDAGSITALDYSPNMVAVARKKNPERDSPRLRYRIGDLYELKDKGMYDIAVCYSCYPHFIDKPLALSILHDSLRPNGRLVIAHSSSKEEINDVHTERGKVISLDLLPPISDLVSLFRDVGFNVEYVRDDSDYYMMIGRRRRCLPG